MISSIWIFFMKYFPMDRPSYCWSERRKTDKDEAYDMKIMIDKHGVVLGG